MTAAESSPITIIITRGEDRPKKRINIYIDEDMADAIQKLAALTVFLRVNWSNRP